MGLNVAIRDKANPKLPAYRRNIYFPEFLFELGLTGHREERFAKDRSTRPRRGLSCGYAICTTMWIFLLPSNTTRFCIAQHEAFSLVSQSEKYLGFT